ncbi:glycosyltransferase family 28 domain-containing protein [Plectosphaerella plurivora]|uniref:Glycosyltransferase family 28 domain-containing protein n=1 Tax=Plectosphaerella plurivora TaxID=936078 RepID=A0A9P9AGG4_9PEZI|nr:glycosyltransferase family 28 domain-containing protein [Plectosphaerella plurivora]
MAMYRTRSRGLGHIAIDDSDADTLTSGNVARDGRFEINFHDSPQALTRWFHRCESAIGKPPECPLTKTQTRRASTAVFMDEAAAAAEAATATEASAATSPRLNIAIHIVGSRGDVQPFIPIAQLLMRAPFNHRVRICTHPIFKDFVESNGVEFFSIGGDPEALMAYMVKNPGLLPSLESVKAGDIGKRRAEMWEIINSAWRSCIESGNGMGPPIRAAHVEDPKDLFIADAIIANPPSMAHLHCAEKLGIALHMVFTMPWSPTQKFHHPLAAMNYGKADASTANYLSYMMMELLTWQGLGDLINKFRRQTLHLDPISSMWGYQLLPRLRVPYSYLWSQSLIPRPSDWDEHIDITGFSFLPLADSYTPPADLAAFLEAGPPPVYIGFGSIVVDDPAALTDLIFNAIRIAGVRVILSKGWGGMGGDNIPENVHLVGNCPHDWLFRRVSAVVHHGGAGTTAAGIAAGRPTVVVPFFGDQLFWGQMIARAGAGPDPVPYKQMTAEKLAESILFALRPEVTAAVQDMADEIAQEDGAGDTARSIQDRLDLESLRCELCPDRVANWKHKKTGARLSGFAVACLINTGVMKPHEIKMIRHKHWYVDEGAEHPVIGAVAAVTGYFTAVGVATTDWTDRLRKRPSNASLPKDDASSESTRVAPAEKHVAGDTPLSPIAEQGNEQGNHLAHLLPENTLTAVDMENIARKMANKSLRSPDPAEHRQPVQPTCYERGKTAWKSRETGRHGIAMYTTRATGRFATDVATASLKAPVAFFYNVANGFHNYPSYGFNGRQVRRRDEITGFGSGVGTAGKEFVLGFYDAFSGLGIKPYLGAKEQGAKGLGKGVYTGMRDFLCNIGAATFGLTGYTLKGIEKEFSKRHLTNLKAEIVLIRLRQGIEQFRKAEPDDRMVVVKRWAILQEEIAREK